MLTINDYKIPSLLLKSFCKARGCDFVNLEIEFDLLKSDSIEDVCFKNNKIYISNPSSLIFTIKRILHVYMDQFEIICGKTLFMSEEEKKNIIVFINEFINNLSCKTKIDKPVASKLYQFPLQWIILNDIIAPIYKVKIPNYLVITCHSPVIDVSNYLDTDKVKIVGEYKEPIIFMNADIAVYSPCYCASLLVESIKSCGLNVHDVIKDILSSSIKNKLIGISKLAFESNKDTNSFLLFLITFSGVYNTIEQVIMDNHISDSEKNEDFSSKLNKYAQFGFGSDADNTVSSWWYLGLIERMLAPSRGPDFTAHQVLEELGKALREKIEKARNKKGRDGLSYEYLLRIKNEENEKGDKKPVILEKSLSTDRIW